MPLASVGGLIGVGAGIGILPVAFVSYTLAANRCSSRERDAAMPGDEMIPEPMFATTQAITMSAAPERVWPWIVQMGAGRGGWYSFDIIDNGGAPSATVVLSQYQQIAPGHVLPALPGATDAFVVLAVDAPRSLVLGGPPDSAGGQRVTWTFLLAPLEGERTRLVVRARVSEHWLVSPAPRESTQPKRFIEHIYAFMARLPKPLLVGFAGLGHRMMQNEQLRGLKRRAEETRVPTGSALRVGAIPHLE